jgi:hypothetical protein
MAREYEDGDGRVIAKWMPPAFRSRFHGAAKETGRSWRPVSY